MRAGRAATARLSGRGPQESAVRPASARPLSLRTPPIRQAPGNSPEAEVDWQRVAIFVTGIALGLTLGAGATLLLAPRSGEETRSDLARRGRRLRSHTLDAWEELRDDLRLAARRGRRKLARTVGRIRHRDDDLLDEPARRRAAG
jgi:gas vesicle protein